MPGTILPSKDNELISSNGNIITSAGGLAVLIALTALPMMRVFTATFLPVSLVKAAARSTKPAL